MSADAKSQESTHQKWVYFADLNCGFGSSSSCFLYDKISRVLRHLYRWKTGLEAVVYLDDGLQMGISEAHCNDNLKVYLAICREINLPTSEEKTVYATRLIIFLGLMLDAVRQLVGIPEEKVAKALNMLDHIIGAKKVTVLEMQRITGLLNFFCRAIVPGQSFTRRLYSNFASLNMKPHYHIRLTGENRLDLGVWRRFLAQDQAVLRPFVDFQTHPKSKKVIWASDAAKAPQLGYAACFWDEKTRSVFYAFDQWETGLLEIYDPSIQFLELLAVTVGVILFTEKVINSTVDLWCDNQAVVQMIENSVSSCKHCMKLIRLITLMSLRYNVVYRANHIPSKDNRASDLLSRQKINQFLRQVESGWRAVPVATPVQLLPVKKFLSD